MNIPIKKEIEDIIKKYPDNFCKVISSKFEEFYKTFNDPLIKKSEQIYKWLTDKRGICLNCGRNTKFESIHKGYREFCSNKCVNESVVIKQKILDSNFKKFGCKNPSQNVEIKNKKQNTFIKKYGVNCSFLIKNVKEKANKSLIKKYGTPYVLKNKKIREKGIITKKKNFYKKCKTGDRLSNVILLNDELNFNGIYSDNLEFKCKICNHEFRSYIKYGNDPVCPMCSSSIFQNEIVEFIKTLINRNKIIVNSRDIIESRELDIFIPHLNLSIECNGNYWHSEISGKKLPYYHLQKTELCEKKNIHLVQIFEDEWLNKKDIVKNRLRHILKINSNKIYSRKCVVKEVNVDKCKDFLNTNHIQGSDASIVKLGLFFNNNLVSVMTFSNLRKSLGNNTEKNSFELCRYATSEPVVGGAGKLLNYFIKTYNPKKIISYADRRWSYIHNNLYEKIGFKKYGVTKCNYWYMKDYRHRYHRFGFRKDVLPKRLKQFDSNLTEWENMKNNGFDRIWDCGSIKYKMEL